MKIIKSKVVDLEGGGRLSFCQGQKVDPKTEIGKLAIAHKLVSPADAEVDQPAKELKKNGL